jgi:hypothetical protein
MRTLSQMIFGPQTAEEKAFAAMPEIAAFKSSVERTEDRRALGRQLAADVADQARGNPSLTAARERALAQREAARAALAPLTQLFAVADAALNGWIIRLANRIEETRRQLEATRDPRLGRYAGALDTLRCRVREVPFDAPAPGTRTNPRHIAPPQYYVPDAKARPYGTVAKLLALRGEVEELAYRPDLDLDAELARIAARAEDLAGEPLDLRGLYDAK